MSKTETLRRSAAASNEERIERLAGQIDDLAQAKLQSVDDLAERLEPLARAMAQLTTETQKTLASINNQAHESSRQFTEQLTTTTQALTAAAQAAEAAANALTRASSRLRWKHYALAVAASVLTAGLTTGFWLSRKPPDPPVQLDARAVAEYLKPALIEAVRPSRGR